MRDALDTEVQKASGIFFGEDGKNMVRKYEELLEQNLADLVLEVAEVHTARFCGLECLTGTRW